MDSGIWIHVKDRVHAIGKRRNQIIPFIQSDGTYGFENPSAALIAEIKLWRSDWMD